MLCYVVDAFTGVHYQRRRKKQVAGSGSSGLIIGAVSQFVSPFVRR